MSPLQTSLAAMFGWTAAVAVAIVLFQNVSAFWLLVIGSVLVCFLVPAWEGINPVALGAGYMLISLVFGCTLCYCMKVPVAQAMVPCFFLPALAYIVGFVKGMENA